MVRWNIKKYRFASENPPGEFGSIILWACFSAGGPGRFVQIHGIMDSFKYQQINKTKSDCLCKKSDNGPCLDLPSRQWSKTNIKINTNVSLSTKLSFCHMSENEWGELKRRSTNIELWIWRIWRYSVWRNGLLSLVSCSPNSSCSKGENSELLSWDKDVAIIGCQ